MNSVSISFDRNNCYIIKTHYFHHQIVTTIAKIGLVIKSFYQRNTNNNKDHILLVYHATYQRQFLPKHEFFRNRVFIIHTKCPLKNLRIILSIFFENTTILNMRNFSTTFNGKLSSESNLIFM